MSNNNNKRTRSPSIDLQKTEQVTFNKRVCIDDHNSLLSELSQVLNTIKSTPSSGEISAEVMETFKALLLEIEQLSSSEDAEAKKMKQESELCLESWFDELLARCEADGELNWEELYESDEEEQDQITIAMVEEEEEEEDDEEIIIIDDEGSEVGSQVLAVL